MKIVVLFLFSILNFDSLAVASKTRKDRYHKMPEIYSYQERKVEEEQEDPFVGDIEISDTITNSSDFGSGSVEDYLETAIAGDALEWHSLPESEYPRAETSDLTAHHTTINVPLFYGNDAEKYGITSEKMKKSFFAIYLRKYYWGNLDTSRPIKHVILVAGGPGESGQSWTAKLHKLSRQYGRSNLIFYVADHRGVYKSRDVVELITKETEKGKSRTSWRRIRRNEQVSEKDWIKNVPEFERLVGYPLVVMTCSNAARDLALISLVIRKYNIRSAGVNARIYLHAQSYGTQVVTRTLNLLPNFYDGVLLEGLATMELVKESAKADFGILSSCAEDRKCSKQFSVIGGGDLLSLRSPFDLRKLLEDMTQKSHNRACRDVFLTQFRSLVYSESIKFWDAIHLSFYELLADDFVNPYTGKHGNFYPGMLVLPFIRDMYYCRDVGKFSKQVEKIIEVIAISVRGLKQPYVKTPSAVKSKPVDPSQISSYFVQTYINAHEAFDMRGMSRADERGYCDRPHQPDLVNQCPIWKEQVRKLGVLMDLSEKTRKAPSVKTAVKKIDKRREKLNKFEGKYKSASESSLSSLTSTSTSTSSSASEDDSSVDTSDSGSFYKSFVRTIKLFTEKEKVKKNKKRKNKKKKKKDSGHDSIGIKWLKQPKTEKDELVDDHKSKGPKTNKSASSLSFLRKYYYEMDDLAYEVPKTEKTKIFVTVGSLDIKTPLLEARRLLARIRSPLKILFELKNVAHSTEPCRGEIVRALVTDESEIDQSAALGVADECVRELGSQRKLDWELEDVKNIPKEDWLL